MREPFEQEPIIMGKINSVSIPPELRDISRWVLWRKTEAKPNGRFGKQPVNSAGYPISVTDPTNWQPFRVTVEQLEKSPAADGIGFCLSNEQVDTPEGKRFIVGIDIDECVSQESGGLDSDLNPKVRAILDLVNSYAE